MGGNVSRARGVVAESRRNWPEGRPPVGPRLATLARGREAGGRGGGGGFCGSPPPRHNPARRLPPEVLTETEVRALLPAGGQKRADFGFRQHLRRQAPGGVVPRRGGPTKPPSAPPPASLPPTSQRRQPWANRRPPLRPVPPRFRHNPPRPTDISTHRLPPFGISGLRARRSCVARQLPRKGSRVQGAVPDCAA